MVGSWHRDFLNHSSKWLTNYTKHPGSYGVDGFSFGIEFQEACHQWSHKDA